MFVDAADHFPQFAVIPRAFPEICEAFPQSTQEIKGGCTFHIKALQDKKLMVAGLVEECRQPRLVPDPAVGMLVFKPLVPGNSFHSWQLVQLGHHLQEIRIGYVSKLLDNNSLCWLRNGILSRAQPHCKLC